MYNKKSWNLLLVLVLLLVTILAGCSGNGKQNQNSPKDTGGSTNVAKSKDNGSQSDEKKGLLITKDPLQLSIHLHYADNFIFDNEWPVFKRAAELTNIRLKGTASKTSTNSEEMFNIMVVSGDIPDIVHFNKKDRYNELGAEGAFEPLNDLIEEHAPHIKAFLDENPDVRRFATAPDGNIYFLNFVLDGDAAKGWFIRTDWLKELKLEVPKTVDELYQVMKAFREQDPNRNNKKDEVPYFSRSAAGITDLMILWKAYAGIYAIDGKVIYGPYEPEYKTAVSNIAKWYAEDLIDKEIYTRGGKSRDILLGDNVGGVTSDWFGSTAGFNDLFKDSIPGFEFLTMAPPAGVDGVIRETSKRAKAAATGWGISSTSKHKVEAIKYFDFWFTEEGRRLMNFGVEGVHYEMVNGEPIFTDAIMNDEKGVLARLQLDGVQIEIGFKQDFAYELQWMNEYAKAGVEEYMVNGYSIEQYPPLTYTSEEQERLNSLNAGIKTYVDEMLQKWVLGAEPIEKSYDEFISKLKQMGVEEVIQLEQQAYDRYMSN